MDGQELFGNAVAVSGDTVVVGARRNYDGKPGHAYVFAKGPSGWAQQAKLGDPLADKSDSCGTTVSIWGDDVVFTCPGADSNTGLVRLFHRKEGAWAEVEAFLPQPSILQIARSVALDGPDLLVGDNWYGRATLFHDDGLAWKQGATFEAEPAYNLAYSVGLSGDVAVLGGLAPNAGEHGNAYAFVRGNGEWSSPITLLPKGAVAGGGFGNPVAVSGLTIVVSAPWDGEKGEDAGAFYIFELEPSPMN